MIAIVKMTNWYQIEINLESPEDLDKLATFINEGRVVVIASDIQTLEDEEQIEIKGKIIE